MMGTLDHPDELAGTLAEVSSLVAYRKAKSELRTNVKWSAKRPNPGFLVKRGT